MKYKKLFRHILQDSVLKYCFNSFITISFLFIFSCDLLAFIKSGVCDPYYASLKSDKVNSHKGPGKEYKICFEYIKKGIPVMIIAKYDHWRKIKDPSGDESWIHKSLLSPKRFVITISENPAKLISESNDSGNLIAFVKKNVVMELMSIRGNWCRIELYSKDKKYMGWMKKENIFGVFENETR